MYKFNVGDKVLFHGKNTLVHCTVAGYGVGRTESINGSEPRTVQTYQVKDDRGYPIFAEEDQLTTDSDKTIGEELEYLKSLPTYLTDVAHVDIYIGAIMANGTETAWHPNDKIFILFVNNQVLDSCLTAEQVKDKLKDLTAFVKVLKYTGGTNHE